MLLIMWYFKIADINKIDRISIKICKIRKRINKDMANGKK